MIWDICQVKEGERQICILELEYGLTKYLFKKKLTEKSVDKFLERYLAGKLRAFVKVEELKNNFEGDVMVRN